MNTNYAPRPYGLSANRLFTLADALFGDRTTPETQGWVPPVDVIETDSHYSLAAELPGVNGNEVKVVVRDGVLTLTGERPALPEAEGTRIQLTERRFGAFKRRFALPKDADGERVSAEFKNGVLTISVPKRDEVKPREIEVRIA
jgi:HSP20 family protein